MVTMSFWVKSAHLGKNLISARHADATGMMNKKQMCPVIKMLDRLAAYEDTELVTAEVAELKKRQRWVPVSERLPNATDGDYFGMILVCWDGRKSEPKLHSCIETVTVGKMLELYRSGQWNVTHWMPLPEPPKEETR